MLKDNDNSFIVPTFDIIVGIVESIPETSIFMKKKAEEILTQKGKNMRKAYEAGLLMGFGTDCGASPLIHGGNAREFILRQEYCGMKEVDLLKQATIDSAKIIGVDDCLGSIKPGKIADIIIVDGDHTKDISLMTSNIEVVIKSGKVVKQ